jgi:hypothetical protein
VRRWGQGPVQTLEHSEIVVKAFLSLIQSVPWRGDNFRSSFPLLIVTSLEVEACPVAELARLSLLYFVDYLLDTLFPFILFACTGLGVHPPVLKPPALVVSCVHG